MATVDALIDLWALKSNNGVVGKAKDKGKKRDDRRPNQKNNYKGKGKVVMGETKKHKSGGCFICDGPHMARECPKREWLNALVADGKQDSENTEVEEVRVSPLQLLVGAIQATFAVA